MKDPIVELVCKDLQRRSKLGIRKYGVTLARTDLELLDWLQHAYEETLDNANYLKAAIESIRCRKEQAESESLYPSLDKRSRKRAA